MASEILAWDKDGGRAAGAVTNDANKFLKNLRVDPITGRLLVDAAVSFTDNTQYNEDAAMSDGALGQFVLGVRQDADTSPVSANGDFHGFIFDNAGALKVNVKTLPALAAGANTIGSVKLTNGTNVMDVVTGTYGKPGLVIRPHDSGGFSDAYANNPQNYVDENFNQIIQGVFPFIFNGTTWDRIKSAANAINSTGTGIAAVGLTAQLDDTSPTTITENQFGNLRITTKRALHITPKPDTANQNNGKVISAGSTNATSVVANAATIKFLTASNINASPRYLKIYNKASAPTVGSDTPVHTYLLPGNTAGAGTNLPLPDGGLYLGTGFALAITTGATDADTGAVSANENIVNYSYENIG